jgi:hypothetical protein
MHNNIIRFLFFFQTDQPSDENNENTEELENPNEDEDSSDHLLNDQNIIDE